MIATGSHLPVLRFAKVGQIRYNERHWQDNGKETGMDNEKKSNIDEGLLGNEKIEEAIAALQSEPTEEMLAHTLTVIRRRIREQGQVIVAIEPQSAGSQLQVQAIQTGDGSKWWAVFTSFEEELKGAERVMSMFLVNLEELFASALVADGITGVIINPWHRTIMLDKTLIAVIQGTNHTQN